MPQLIALFETTQIQWIMVLLAIDVALGIIAALIRKDFQLGKVANFMVKPVLGYILGFVILEMTAQALPSLAWIVAVAFVLVILALVGSILNNLGKIGLPLPSYLKK